VNLSLLLDMAVAGHGDRVALGPSGSGLTFAGLARCGGGGASVVRSRGTRHLLFLGRNGAAMPQLLFAAAGAGIPFTPLNYRLPADRIDALIGHFDTPLVVADPDYQDAVAARSWCLTADFLATAAAAEPADAAFAAEDAPAVQLFTSGTTADPKIVSLSHGNLASYVVETVEFGSARPGECALTTTPPYHIAAVASVLTNLYAGRRVVYLSDFDPAEWLRLVRAEAVTSAMVVPTMLSRILDVLGGQIADAPQLRLLSYGGSRAAPPVVEAAMAAFPHTGFCNAYGLTETSSTVALLGPDEHRIALTSGDPAVRRRLSSVGRPVPGVEIEVRDEHGNAVPPGATGELWVRGPQVTSGGAGGGGWFPTRDRGSVDAEGYIFVYGRLDDTIIRGGENIAPSEIEDVLRRHPAVADVAIVGVPDERWGQQILAAIVRRPAAQAGSDEIRQWARERLRGSRTPDRICWVDKLPYSATGKLIRRDVAVGLGGCVAS
jgi:acyl-CoA synthetase (AMP-forming)/AMP-acid ligase II